MRGQMAAGALRAVTLSFLVALMAIGAVLVSLAPAPAGATTVSVPSSPVGTQLDWLLSITQLPLSTPLITDHFDATFLAKATPAQLNAGLATLGAGVPKLLGLSDVEPTSLEAVA